MTLTICLMAQPCIRISFYPVDRFSQNAHKFIIETSLRAD